MTQERISAERAAAALLASAMGGLAACLGGWLGVMRVLAETYRSCPVNEAEARDAMLAGTLGEVALVLLFATTVAALWGLVQGVRRRSPRPAWTALLLGVVTLGFGLAAAAVPHTTMC